MLARPLFAALAAALAAAPAGAATLISEVYYDAVGSDNGLSFIELSGSPGTVLDGLVVEGVNGSDGAVAPSLSLTGVIGGSGLFVIADESSAGATLVSGADLVRNFDLQNGPDSVVLRGPDGILDAVGYGVFAPGDVFAGEGSPAPDPAAGQSIARVFADLDTGDNAADFAALETPTPGSASFSAVPEPGALGLGLAGLAGLALLRPRRR